MKTTDIKIYSCIILMLLSFIAAFQTNEVIYEKLFISLSVFLSLKLLQITDRQIAVATID